MLWTPVLGLARSVRETAELYTAHAVTVGLNNHRLALARNLLHIVIRVALLLLLHYELSLLGSQKGPDPRKPHQSKKVMAAKKVFFTSCSRGTSAKIFSHPEVCAELRETKSRANLVGLRARSRVIHGFDC